MANETIPFTRPFLPPLDQLTPHLQHMWNSRILTNGGPFHSKLEEDLCDFLRVKHICLFANGTIALTVALQALQITGEVITTPFTFVATVHALRLNGLMPVFVDIDPNTLNLAPERIAGAITSKTSGIMPVHCYGRPCDTVEIKRAAQRHNLRVIYDAAHAFNVRVGSRSILNFGDLSVLSFHATKVFNTFEGGAIVCHDRETKKRVDRLKCFGTVNEDSISDIGTNGKMSEFNAALGLLQLKYIDQAIARRKAVDAVYRKLLSSVAGIQILDNSAEYESNYSYFPILVQEHFPLLRDQLHHKLRAANISSRKYFFPLVSNLPMYRQLPSAQKQNLPIANVIANQVLCLPIYPELMVSDIERSCELIAKCSLE